MFFPSLLAFLCVLFLTCLLFFVIILGVYFSNSSYSFSVSYVFKVFRLTLLFTFIDVFLRNILYELFASLLLCTSTLVVPLPLLLLAIDTLVINDFFVILGSTLRGSGSELLKVDILGEGDSN